MNRQTALLGLLGTVLVLALWWFLLYSPGQEQLAMVEDEITAAENESQSLMTRINQLEQVRSRAPETEALIAQLGGIVPADDPALPAALRQIEAAAQDAGVTISQLSTSRPSSVEGADGTRGLYSISVSMSLEGSFFQIGDFLRRLEDPGITSRGLTFNSLNLAPSEYPTLTGSISGTMYAVLDPPPEGGDEAPAPAPTQTDDGGDGADVDVDVDTEDGGSTDAPLEDSDGGGVDQ